MRERHRRGRNVALVCALAIATIGIRSRLLRWGTTREEPRRLLPGDGFVPSPNLVATRAMKIHAAAEEVWPWIAQMGQGRGGFYSYDALENLVGCAIQSAHAIVAEWQDIRVGDPFGLHPEVSLEVAAVIPERALVVTGGVPMREGGEPPYDFSWAFVLDEGPEGSTRLLVRERYRYTRRWAPLVVEPVQLVSFLMTQRMLRGIRDRAESYEAEERRNRRSGTNHISATAAYSA